MALTGTMLPGRGLTCMKSWALGEEFSTMRFTILMRVSLSLICSRGRNGRTVHTHTRGDSSPRPLHVFQETGKESCSRASKQPALGLTTARPCELRVRASTKAALEERPQGELGNRWAFARSTEYAPAQRLCPGMPDCCGSHPHWPRLSSPSQFSHCFAQTPHGWKG